MLRIKLASGEETVFRTVAELALGIQKGVVTSRALIYHQRSEKWIPVTVHPAYKTALEGGSALAAQAAAPTTTTAVEEPPAVPQPRPAAAGPKPVMPSPPPPPIATPAQRVAGAPKVEAPTPAPPKAPTPPLPPVPAPPVAIAPLPEVEPPAPAPPKASTPPLPPVPAPPVAITPLPEVEPQAPAPPKASTPPLPPVPAPPVTIAPLPEVEAPAQAIPGLVTDNAPMGLELDEILPAKAEPVSGADVPKPPAAAPSSGDELPQLLLTSEISLTDMTTRHSGPNPMVVEPPRPRTSGPVEVHHAAPAPRRTRKPPIALTAALVLIAVAALATWGLLRSPSTPASADSTAAPAPASHPPVAAAPTRPEATAPAAPAALSPDSLARRYANAQDSARAEFDTALVRIHFGRLLVAERLGSLDSLRLAHQVITTAAGVLGAYRTKGAAIDQSFQDSAKALAQRQAWSASDLTGWKARPSRLESPEMARLTDSLLANVDGVYQVLTNQMGQYDYTPASVAFLDPESMQKYAGYRSWLTRRVGALNGVPSAKLSPVLATVLRAVGSVNLPAAFAKEPVIPNAPDLPKDSGN